MTIARRTPWLSRRMGLVALGALGALGASDASHAQQYAHRDVPAGRVTGLELGVDGALEVPAGGRLRWFVTVYEVIAHRDLRPSPSTSLSVLASFRRTDAAAEIVTDANGRAAIELDVPATLEGGFDLVVEARAPRREGRGGSRAIGISRRFDVNVVVGPRMRMELFVDRTTVARGASFHAWGRVIDRARNAPATGRLVRVALAQDRGGSLLEPEVRTDARGLFRATLRASDELGVARVIASTEGASAASTTVTVRDPERPDLVVYATPARHVVLPGARVEVDVVVRTRNGRPVAGAVLTGLSIPAANEERHIRATRTDARGHARVPWDPAPATRASAYRDLTGTLEAVRPGIGTGNATVKVRVGRADAIVTFAVEGGALVPTLPGALFVRVQGPDGAPRVGASVSLQSRTLSAEARETDAHGIAVLETRWGASSGGATVTTAGVDEDGEDAADGCAGPTVAAASVRVGAHTEALCIPVDPDATTRVRVGALAEPGGTLDVEVLRRSEVARAPVALMVLALPGDGPARPLVERVVAPGASHAPIVLPADTMGLVWVRARPLVGGERQEVRGGGALVRVVPNRALAVALDASSDGAVAVRVAGSAEPTAGFVFAVPPSEGRALLAALTSSHGVAPSAGETLGPDGLRGELAARTPLDVAAPSVLRDGTVLPVTMPTEPVTHGLLRDPWRTRARFVRGRLGRMFRAIQDRVAACSPGSLDEVGVETRRGWRFNRELLTPILAGLGPEAVSGIDGSELDLDALVALDPGFSFDQVARRVTRERLLRVLVALDSFVRTRGLGYTWARRGDPSTWLASLAEGSVESSAAFEPNDLFDGWGRPFAVRRATSGRARFRFLEPVVGWEIVSSGPDGRFATADDFWDPFARVLAPGSVYGEAVGEEMLLARLSGVELGRATIDALGALFEIEAAQWASSDASSSAASTWDDAIGTIDTSVETLRTFTAAPVIGAMQTFAQGEARVALTLDEEPRSYLVVAGAYGPSGELSFAARPVSAGVPLAIETTTPTTLVVGDRLRFPVDVTWLGRGALVVGARIASVSPPGAGAPIEVAVSHAEIAEGASGEGGAAEIELSAIRPGRATLRIEVRDARGRALRTREARIRVSADGTLRAQHTAALVSERATLHFDEHTDATAIERRLVLLRPLALAHDPGFAPDASVAVRAWADAARGETIPAALLTALSHAEHGSLLEVACAAVAWSASGANEIALGGAMDALRARVSSGAREDAAALVALAPAAAGLAPAAGHADPVASRIARWRRRAWAALATERDDPGLLARFAAGLLLADQGDRAGVELYRLARRALVDGERGGRTLPPDPRHDDDGVASTAALAIAARQVGDGALGDALTRALAPRVYLAMRDDDDTTFWLVAASTMGAFGSAQAAEDHIELDAGDGTRSVSLDARGVAAVTLDPGVRAVTVSSRSPLLARIVARYARPVATRDDGPLRVRLEGHAGHAFETSAFELVVESDAEQPITRPIVEIALPSAALLDGAAYGRLTSVAGVAYVELPDAVGMLRIVLSPLAPHRELRIPIALPWIAAGRSRGLAVAVYDDARPWQRSTLAPRTWSLTSTRAIEGATR